MRLNLMRRTMWLSVAITVASLAVLRAQTLRTLTADGHEETPVRSVCGGMPIFKPASQPPSGPVVFLVALCFDPTGSQPRLPPEEYLHQIHLRRSTPSQSDWVPYDESAERAIFEDYRRLTDHAALAAVSVDVSDYRFANGVIGKIVSYHLTEKN
jgi:hypothetical protein